MAVGAHRFIGCKCARYWVAPINRSSRHSRVIFPERAKNEKDAPYLTQAVDSATAFASHNRDHANTQRENRFFGSAQIFNDARARENARRDRSRFAFQFALSRRTRFAANHA